MTDLGVQQRLLEIRPPRIAMFLAGTAVMAHAVAPQPALTTIAAPAAITGGLGFTVMIRAWWLFRKAGTAICPTEMSTALIEHDVFAVSRNPMYLGIIMMLAAPALMFGSIPFYAAAVAFAVIIDRVFCPYEESKLEAEFGARYRSYRSRVRRWL